MLICKQSSFILYSFDCPEAALSCVPSPMTFKQMFQVLHAPEYCFVVHVYDVCEWRGLAVRVTEYWEVA